MTEDSKTDVINRIKDYLLSGGMWNPELAIHDNVRDLIIDCRTEIENLQREIDELKDWKESALVEFNKIQTQEIGKEIGTILGSSIHEQILPAIKNLKIERDDARKQNAKLRDIAEWFANHFVDECRELPHEDHELHDMNAVTCCPVIERGYQLRAELNQLK
jgi:hypothetical protein